ncbi:hypothetical protein B0O80DRAFT_22527, partial [Mortierella sp. GBAus27b]
LWNESTKKIGNIKQRIKTEFGGPLPWSRSTTPDPEPEPEVEPLARLLAQEQANPTRRKAPRLVTSSPLVVETDSSDVATSTAQPSEARPSKRPLDQEHGGSSRSKKPRPAPTPKQTKPDTCTLNHQKPTINPGYIVAVSMTHEFNRPGSPV